MPDTYTDEARTLFESFDFDRLHLMLENDSFLSNLERAFYSYQLSDWNKAILFYARAMNEARTQRKKGLQFIAGFSVLALKQKPTATTDFSHSELDTIQSLSMENLLASTKQEDLEGIHQELAEDTFINSNYDTLRDIHRLIQG